jgi:hypothetical protein
MDNQQVQILNNKQASAALMPFCRFREISGSTKGISPKAFMMMLLFGFTMSLPGMAQSDNRKALSSQLNAINSHLKQTDTELAFTIEMKSFEDAKDVKPSRSESAEFLSKGFNHFYMGNNLSSTLQHEDKMLILDKEEKKMLLINQDYGQKQQAITGLFKNLPTDSILQLCSSIVLISKSENLSTWKLNFDSPLYPYSYIQLQINTKNQLLKQIVLQYANEIPLESEDGQTERLVRPRLEINYTPLQFNAELEKKLKLSTYVQHTANRKSTKSTTQSLTDYKPSKAYQNYQIINN